MQPVSASESFELPEYNVLHTVDVYNSSNVKEYTKGLSSISDNGTQEHAIHDKIWYVSGFKTIHTTYEFYTHNPPLIKKGGDSIVTMFEGYYSLGVTNTSGGFGYYRNVHNTRALVTYADGTSEYIDDVTYSVFNAKVTLTFEFIPNKDVTRVKFFVMQEIDFTSPHYLTLYLGEIDGIDSGYNLSLSQQSEESGILSGLFDWVKKISDKVGDGYENVKDGFSNIGGWLSDLFNSIVDGFSNIGNWLSDLFDSMIEGFSNIGNWLKNLFDSIIEGFSNIGKWFAELPSKLWEVISNGLKNLFVPDNEYMVDYSTNWDNMLSDRLGAVYQVVNVIDDFWQNVQTADQVNTINMPLVSIPLPEGNIFSFGGYDVKIVPDGFGFVVDSLKLIIGIVCTTMFINGLKKRYDEVMEGK